MTETNSHKTKSVSWTRKTLRFFKRVGVAILLFLILFFIVLNLPATQGFLTNKVEIFLEEKLQTEVEIGAITWQLPKQIALQKVELQTPVGDSLFQLGKLAIGIDIWGLFSHEIRLTNIDLKDVYGNVFIQSDTSNIAFLLDAFVLQDTSTIRTKTSANSDKNSSPWEIVFNNAPIKLSNIDVHYENEPKHILVDIVLGELAAKLSRANVLAGRFDVEALTMKNATIYLDMDAPKEAVISMDTTIEAITETDYRLNIKQAQLEAVKYEMKANNRYLLADVGDLEANVLEVRISDTIAANISDCWLANSAFILDELGAPKVDGLDPNHLHFEGLTGQFKDLKYQDMEVEVEVEQLAGIDPKGITIDQLQTYLNFQKSGLTLKNLSLKTKKTDLKNVEAEIIYPFLDATADLRDMELDIRLPEGQLYTQDLFYFYPSLEDFIRPDFSDVLQINAQLNGSLKDLNFPILKLQNKNTNIDLKGRILQPLDMAKMGLDIKINQFDSRGGEVLECLSENALPIGTKLPENFILNGEVKGLLNKELNLAINLHTHRDSLADETLLRATGMIDNLLNINELSYNFQIDTFLSTRDDLMAYLPKNTLPESIVLPNNLTTYGRINGTIDSVFLDLQSYANDAIGKGAFYTKGSIFKFDNPSLNLHFSKLDIDGDLLTTFLPKNTLPKTIVLPNINDADAIVRGTLEDLFFEGDLMTNAGEIKVETKLEINRLSLSTKATNFDLKKIAKGQLLDSLQQLNLDLLNFDIYTDITNYDSLEIAKGIAKIHVQEKNTTNVLHTNVKIEAGKAVIDLATATEAGNVFSVINYDLIDQKVDAKGGFTQIDFNKINYAQMPLILSGDFDLEAEYDSLNDMTAQLQLANIGLEYEEELMSLLELNIDTDFRLDNKQARLRSDWVDANFSGTVDFNTVAQVVDNQVNRFWGADFKDTLTFAENTTFDFNLDWKDTELLTTGIVPNLTKITPFTLDIIYDDAQQKLQTNLQCAAIIYQDIDLSVFQFSTKIEDDTLQYKATLANLKLPNEVDLAQFNLQGGLHQGLLSAGLINRDTMGEKVLDVLAYLKHVEDSVYQIQLAHDVVLNGEPWHFKAGNQLRYDGEKLRMKNWELTNEAYQSLALNNFGTKGIQLLFSSFKIEELLALVHMESYGGGIVNGSLEMPNPLENLQFEADLQVNETRMYDAPIGQLEIQSKSKKEGVYQAALSLLGEGNKANVSGVYNANNRVEVFDFQANIDSLQLKPLGVFMDDYLSEMQGNIHGNAHLTGNIDAPSLVGNLQFSDAGCLINELGTSLHLGEENIELDGNVIRFDGLSIFDNSGNKGFVNAFIITEDFVNYAYDLDIIANDFLVLNTTEKENSLYYGKLIVDATAHISGDISSPRIEADVSPKKDSKLTYVMPSESRQIDKGNGIVTFIDGAQKTLNDTTLAAQNRYKSETAEALNLTVITNLDLNENLDFTAIIDPYTGDNFQGKGDGFLVFTMFPTGAMDLSGTFDFSEGEYLFTYKNFVKRRFAVQPESSLTWTGDIYNPKLDIEVQYKTKTNAYPLVAGQQQLTELEEQRLRQRETFYVQMNIGGSLEKTDIQTRITYPNISENSNNEQIESAIASLQNNQSRMNEQAFGLVLFNGFIADDFVNSGFQLNGQGTINSAISNQLNTLANRYIKFVELDFNLDGQSRINDVGESINQSNMRVTARKRFLDDRLLFSVDGAATNENRNGNASRQTYLDNLTVEYALTPDGFFKIKVYNDRSQEDELLGTDVVRTGAALVISKDF